MALSHQFFWLLSILLLSFFITAGSSKSCHCNYYSGDVENINADGTCKHCESCTNGNCKCLSSGECSTTFTIVGIVVVIIIIAIFAGYCRRRRRRFRMRQFNQPAVIVQPATYIAPTTQSKQAVVMNSQNVQYVTDRPVIYVQPQYNAHANPVSTQLQHVQQVQPAVYPTLNHQNHQHVTTSDAPPSYDTVAPSVPQQN
eukprot:UN06344